MSVSVLFIYYTGMNAVCIQIVESWQFYRLCIEQIWCVLPIYTQQNHISVLT